MRCPEDGKPQAWKVARVGEGFLHPTCLEVKMTEEEEAAVPSPKWG